MRKISVGYFGWLLALLLATSIAAPPADGAERASAVHRAMDAALTAYVTLCADLAADNAARATAHVKAIESELRRALAAAKDDPTGPLAKEALGVIAAQRADLESTDPTRVRKQLFPLSKPLVRYVGRYRAKEHRWKTYYCSMAKGSWLQPYSGAELANPYYGSKMLRCGDVVRTAGE